MSVDERMSTQSVDATIAEIDDEMKSTDLFDGIRLNNSINGSKYNTKCLTLPVIFFIVI